MAGNGGWGRVSAANKAKGSLWERQVEDHCNAEGFRARRLPRAGSKDIGDVALEHGGLTIIVEAKNVKDAAKQMSQYLNEAEVECANYEAKYPGSSCVGVVVTKTRMKGVGQGRVVMTVDSFLQLLRRG